MGSSQTTSAETPEDSPDDKAATSKPTFSTAERRPRRQRVAHVLWALAGISLLAMVPTFLLLAAASDSEISHPQTMNGLQLAIVIEFYAALAFGLCGLILRVSCSKLFSFRKRRD